MNTKEFRIGITVLAALTSLVILTIVFGKAPSVNFGSDYIVNVRFERAPGITRKSPVYKNGVRIGEVTGVRLIEDDRAVEVSLRIPTMRKIYTDEICQIHQTMIMGDASLELVKDRQFKGEVKLIDPDVPLIGVDASDIFSGFSNLEGDLLKAVNNVSDAAAQFNTLSVKAGGFIEKANVVFGSEEELNTRKQHFDALLANAEQTMISFRKMSEGMNQIIGDPKVQNGIRKMAENMPEILEQAKLLSNETQMFIKEARTFVERGGKSLDKVEVGIDRASAALESIKKVTDSIEGDVPETVAALKKSAVKLQSFFDEITMLVRTVNNSDGSIMKLFREPEFYDKLMNTLDNVERITGEVDFMLRTEMKPIAANVRILTDKAARDPSIFIRNLIRKQPRTKNLPHWTEEIIENDCGECQPELFSVVHSSADEGRIINVDPRYEEIPSTVIQQMSYVAEESEPQPKLVFQQR